MEKQKCFVIMPYGKKRAYNGPMINFDSIYRRLIRPAVNAAQLTCIRCDDIEQPGSIRDTMIQHIFSDAVALVDITTFNPNVFYELGVRHALKRSVTVLIAREGVKVPFNINGLKVLPYNSAKPDDAKIAIRNHIRNGLLEIASDSLVYDVLKLPITTGPHLPVLGQKITRFGVVEKPDREIRIITGQLEDVKGIDVWANSENTNMQMARMWDRSFSSTIRYLGAIKKNGQIKKDLVEDQLTARVGNWATVADAEVIVMGSCALAKQGVKRIFHVASVKGGTPGGGYQPINDVANCVTNSLKEMDNRKHGRLSTILFPLFGAGTARADLERTAHLLVGAATDYLIQAKTRVTAVYFIARTEVERDACLKALRFQVHEKRLTERK
jgi:O-acetyl-ADP-ribose deacetylase (regulator of RNase III)